MISKSVKAGSKSRTTHAIQESSCKPQVSPYYLPAKPGLPSDVPCVHIVKMSVSMPGSELRWWVTNLVALSLYRVWQIWNCPGVDKGYGRDPNTISSHQPVNAQMPDPLVVLPTELCTWFIAFAIDGVDAGPLELLLISRRWARLLLNTPSLWSQIYIQNGEDEMTRISTFLHFSRGCSLHVDIMTALPAMDSLQLIANHISRVSTITLRPSVSDTDTASHMEWWKDAASRILGRLSDGPLHVKDTSCFGISLRENDELYYCIILMQFTIGHTVNGTTHKQASATSVGFATAYQLWKEHVTRCAFSLNKGCH
jgi:hypothetical protein